jgi:hypothetical protein
MPLWDPQLRPLQDIYPQRSVCVDKFEIRSTKAETNQNIKSSKEHKNDLLPLHVINIKLSYRNAQEYATCYNISGDRVG